jgi:hypothetical protein
MVIHRMLMANLHGRITQLLRKVGILIRKMTHSVVTYLGFLLTDLVVENIDESEVILATHCI